MLRPTSYRQAQVVLQDVPYELCEGAVETPGGGLLCKGDLVWTQEPEPRRKSAHVAIGFIDGVGMVSLDPDSLIRADVLNEREVKRPRHSHSRRPTHAEIAALAYSFWEQRSGDSGCAEEDWRRAEHELEAMHSHAD